jgi:GntR family transcriptional repressor for pyruvate dehydrogenase complex
LRRRRYRTAAYDILELRRGLEEIAAFLAAKRAGDTDRNLLRERFSALVKADIGKGDERLSAEADLKFHLAVADASHNVALVHVMRGLHNLLRSSVVRFRARIFGMKDGSEKLLRQQHRAIYEAVMAGDAEAARQAAHLHLNYIETTLREADFEHHESEPADMVATAGRRSRRPRN